MIHKWMEAADALAKICRTVRAVDIRREPFCLTDSQDIGDYILESAKNQRCSVGCSVEQPYVCHLDTASV